MNINLVVVPLSPSGKAELSTRFEAAIEYGQEIYGTSQDHKVLTSDFGLFNSGRLAGTWSVPTWYEGEQTIAVSQPPVPTSEVVSNDTYEKVLRQVVEHEKFEKFLPNHFGIGKNSDGRILVWNDTTGMGRCYFVRNENFFAACNHIGTLAFFLDEPLSLDDVAVGKYAGAGYFMDNDSPYSGIKRIGPGQKIEISARGEITHEQYFNVSELVSPRNESPDYIAVTDEMQTIAKNLDNLSVRTATVYLSGGRDSRMTAGLWLSGGSDANVVTLGTLEREAEIAQDLMSRFSPSQSQSTNHRIQVARGSDITQSLHERVDRAFLMWDGDAAPTNIKRNLSYPTGSAALSIGGVGGEIMHGYYYSRPGMIEKVGESSSPFSFAFNSFGARYLTEEATNGLRDSFDELYEETRRLNLDNYAALDYLYMNQKLRRWGNQALGSTSAIMLCAPAFVRGCFNLQPEEKAAKDFPVHLVKTAIPEWSGVDYYKANPEDSKKLMKRGLATFQSDPEGFADLINRGRNWTKYLQPEKIDEFLKAAERDEATYPQEGWLNRVIWLEALNAHVSFLNGKVSNALSTLKSNTELGPKTVNGAVAEIDSEYLKSTLRDWPFNAAASDSKDADLLCDGQLRLGREIYSIDGDQWELLNSEDGRNYLAFHSLRWIDPLLRSPENVERNQKQWVLFFERWWSLLPNNGGNDRIWNPATLVQRGSALALGGKLIQSLPKALVETHLREIRKSLVQHLDPSLRQKAISALILIYRSYHSETLNDSGLWREIESSLSGLIRDGGGLFGGNAKEMVESKDSWKSFLDAIDPSSEFTGNLQQRIEQTDFWVQSHQPNGELVPFGSQAPEPEVLDAISDLRYVRSHALEGQPPTAVRFVDPHGLVTGRTGWGETERELTEETFWSIVTGSVRSRQEHQDLGRITFSSQGVNWLIDPLNADCASSETHSGVTVDGARYRTNGSSELVVQRETDLVDDYVFRINTFSPVGWRRHVTFARTANYLVIEDHLRASKEFGASISWMVNPDAQITQSSKGVFLTIDGKSVELQISSGQIGELGVEEILSTDGVLLAQRLTASVNGTTARVITIISDVIDSSVHEVHRLAVPGNEYAFRVKDKRVDELIIVTGAGAGLVPVDLDPLVGVEQVIQSIASGNMSEEEAFRQRSNVQDAIRASKELVWEANGSLESRKSAISELIKTAETERVSGTRDHGLAATLIDLAGTDLKALIKDVGIVHNYNRSPIVDWAGENELQEFYQVPIYTTRDSNHLPDFGESRQIWSVDLEETVLASYNIDAPGDTLVVYFHGATDRTRHATPRFERLRTFATIGQGPLMFFADPTLDFDARMILSWYIGNESVDVHGRMADMIASYAEAKNVNHVVLVGNSGGGFTALQVSSYLEGVEVVSVNGQVDLGNYQPRIMDPAYRAVYGKPSESAVVSTDSRFNVIERFRQRGFNNRVLMYQNTGDDHHMKDHYQYFEDAFSSINDREQLFNVEKVFLGDGHVAPSPDSYLDIIRKVVESGRQDGAKFNGLLA